jgi:nitric oxide reductase activation protein
MPLEVSGQRRGGHNKPQHNWDGPVLRDAAARLEAFPAGERLLIVVSDGEPSGPSDAERALHRAVSHVTASDIHLIGVGLGPGTQHVAKYYPDHLANVPLNQFPADLGRLLDRLLTSSIRGAHRARRA